MMLSPSIRDRSDARLSCWLLVGSAQVRVGPPQRLAITPAILACNVHPARSRVPAHPGFGAKQYEQARRTNLLQPYAVVKSP